MQQLATDMLGLGAYMDDAGLSPACNMLFSLTQNCFYKYPVPYHRRGSEEPPESHSHRDRLLPPYLLCGILWCIGRPHHDDAILHAG